MTHARGGEVSVLVFRDDGIGLTEDEVHLFLAAIGQTSKRPELFLQPTSFIGQFGVGLLSCFMVSDEVVVVTRSSKEGGSALEWRGRADFVKCVVNAGDLRPTASRESFYEDEKLAATRVALGQQLRHYLVDLARDQPHRLKKLIGLHYLSLKALAVEDEEFFRFVINWLPFETNLGTMTLTECLKEHEVIRYATDLDEFRQTARIAAAQSLCVINAAYTYDERPIAQLTRVLPNLMFSHVDGLSLTYSFERLTLDEQESAASLVELREHLEARARVAVSDSTVSRALAKLGLPRKKSMRAAERNNYKRGWFRRRASFKPAPVRLRGRVGCKHRDGAPLRAGVARRAGARLSAAQLRPAPGEPHRGGGRESRRTGLVAAALLAGLQPDRAVLVKDQELPARGEGAHAPGVGESISRRARPRD